MNAIILAGGKSMRMGFDKAFLKLKDTPLIKRQLKPLKKIFKKVIIVTNEPDRYNKFRNVKIVRDIIPNRGPLGGIYSGLSASDSLYNFVIACDMPFINPALIRHIIRRNRDNYGIIIPKIDKKYHPLFGVYSKSCIPIIEKALKEDRLKVSTIFPKVKTGFISRNEIERFDKQLLSLININTQDDLMMIGGKLCQR